MMQYPRVEITSPGWLKHGPRFFVVDLVEGDFGRCCMWTGTDYSQAILVAGEMEEEGLPVFDRVVEGCPNA